jgi:hypothetical protein
VSLRITRLWLPGPTATFWWPEQDQPVWATNTNI